MTKTTMATMVAATLLATASAGCKKKVADAPAKGTAGSGSAAVTAGSATATPGGGSAKTPAPTGVGEIKTITMSAGTATLTVPAGWTDAEFNGGRMYSVPAGGIFPSTITVNQDCLGVCGKISDNLAEAATKQIEMHKSTGYTAELVGAAALTSDGLQYELKVSKDTQTFTQIFHYL